MAFLRCAFVLCILYGMAVPVIAAERYHTFAGIGVEGGINRLTYHGWVETEQKDLNISGTYVAAGPVLCVFVPPFVGEWTMLYEANSNSGEVNTSVKSLYLSLAGKYFYSINQWFHLSAGFGVYGEMPPATLSYNGGAGGLALIGCIVHFGSDFRLVFDIVTKYGSFGLGEGSRKFSTGAAVSVLYNVGSI